MGSYTGSFQYTGVFGKVVLGPEHSFYQLTTVSAITFGSACDLMITFPTISGGVILSTQGTSTNTVEYSFNGNTIHGELIPGGGRTTLTFYNRNVSKIWFRVKAGSSGPIVVSTEAWRGA